jgi:hypothetical protein
MHPTSLLHYVTGDFMAENQWPLHNSGELRPISVRDVKVRMAGTAGFYADQDFVRSGDRAVDLLHRERFLELAQDSGLH